MWSTKLCLLLVTLFGADITSGLFLQGEQYTYEYKAVVQTGVIQPSHSASLWQLKCSLDIQPNGTEAYLKLSNCSTSLYNGYLDDETRRHLKENFIPIEAHHLETNFIIHYEEGYSQSISIPRETPLWAVNLKRGLASILQLDTRKLKFVVSKTEENTLRGRVPVEYLIQDEGATTNVWKFLDYEQHCKTTNCSFFSWSSVPTMPCVIEPKILTSFSKWAYSLETINHEFKRLTNLTAVGTINSQLFPPNGELQYILVNQTLRLISVKTEHELKKPDGELRKVDLSFEISPLDMTQERVKLNKKNTVNKIDSVMKRLVDSLEKPPGSLPLDKLHQDYVPYLLQLLYSLDKSGLESYYSELAIGTSYQQETKRNFFLELLPKIGSKASVLFIRDLIVGCKVKEESAVKLLTNFPFYVRDTSEHLLQECEVFFSLGDEKSARIRHTAILSFSNLIYKVCPFNCSPEKFEIYLRKFVDLFTSSTTYNEQMLYLEALSNIESGNTFDYVLPIIRGDAKQLTKEAHHIRFLGVWATMNTAPYHPNEVYELYWPILCNRSEHIEMRVAAFTMLIISGASSGRFLSLYWYMQAEPNTHLKHFFYTTITSLADSQYPCYSYMKPLASLIIPYIATPKNRKWSTGNYIMDYADSENNFGGLAHLFSIGSERTHSPNVLYLQLSNYVLGKVTSNTGIYLKIEGVEESLKREIIKMSTNDLPLSKLSKIVTQLKPQSDIKKPVHIEIIAKTHGRVIFCAYINDTTYHQQLKALRSLGILNQEFHINYQSADVPFSFYTVQPTDIGTPALTIFDSAALLSFRGNFTRGPGSAVSRRNQFDLWYSATLGNNMAVYNPVNNLWHTTRRSFTYQLDIPVNNWFKFSTNPLAFTTGIINPTGTIVSTVAHLRRMTIISGETSKEQLKATCTSCSTVKDVSDGIGDNGLKHGLTTIPGRITGTKLLLSYHHCIKSYEVNWWIFFKSFQNIKKQFQNFPYTESITHVFHYVSNAFLLSETNSCGVKVELVSLHDKDVEFAFSVYQTTQEGEGTTPVKHNLHAAVGQRYLPNDGNNVTILDHWEFMAGITNIPGSNKYEIESEISHIVEDEMRDIVCVVGDILTPPADTKELLQTTPSGKVTGQLNIIFGSSECLKDDLTLNINITAELSEKQHELAKTADIWPHSQCSIEKQKLGVEWGNQTPLTEACYRSSVAMGTLRKYTLSTKLRNVKSQNVVFEPDSLHLELGKSYLLEKIISETTFTVIVPDAPSTDLFLYVNKSLNAISLKPLIEPWLINTHFPLALQLEQKFGWIGSCVITSDLLNTLDNTTKSISLPECYTLAAADCSSEPRFAVLVKQLRGTKFMAAKVFTWGYKTEIIPKSDGNLAITVNGENVPNKSGSYYYPSNPKNHDLKITLHDNGLLELTSKATKIWMQYNSHFTAISIPVLYSFQTCGLCGDFNGDSANDIHQILKLPCE